MILLPVLRLTLNTAILDIMTPGAHLMLSSVLWKLAAVVACGIAERGVEYFGRRHIG